ncbi:hypothetical protein GCM10027418_19320 [Mariniluteicoccus endophyticus]
MGLFRRHPRLDPQDERDLTRARVSVGLRASARVLGAEETGTGWCVAQTDALAHNDGAPQWVVVPWHTIERGGFNAQASSLTWALSDGRRGSVRLDSPGQLPEIFRERVEATILLEEHVPIEGTREGGVVSARRAPDGDEVVWRVRRGRGTPNTDEVNALLDARLAELRAEYS